MDEKIIILVSSSPRRSEILKKFKFKYKTLTPKIEEEIEGDPIEVVKRNAKKKVLDNLNTDLLGLYVGVDTIVYIDGKIIGKPKSLEEAREILRKLSGKKHKVISGIYIYDNIRGIEKFSYIETEVKLKELSEEELEWYVSTGEPMDAAGGYKIQGLGGLFIEWINGDYYNVVGLPINKLYNMIMELGLNPMEFMENNL
ncbi:MAG: Maf family protein [archaeon GBS-70-058]|nr:Maf family protein [Candidatus Culexarchaeum nevadense]